MSVEGKLLELTMLLKVKAREIVDEEAAAGRGDEHRPYEGHLLAMVDRAAADVEAEIGCERLVAAFNVMQSTELAANDAARLLFTRAAEQYMVALAQRIACDCAERYAREFRQQRWRDWGFSTAGRLNEAHAGRDGSASTLPRVPVEGDVYRRGDQEWVARVGRWVRRPTEGEE